MWTEICEDRENVKRRHFKYLELTEQFALQASVTGPSWELDFVVANNGYAHK